MNIMDEIKASFKTGSTLTRLIYINLGVFLADPDHHDLYASVQCRRTIMYRSIAWLGVPWDLPILIHHGPGLSSPICLFMRDFLHILFNLFWLYWFGKIFLSYLSEKQLLSVYLLGGIAGALSISFPIIFSRD